ncbi:mRNA polyadenylation factor [Lithospermum erythrorhizon]|uniref:mRNA polyadenylation factor n=1 Tax=Lithospermum erythrorhizon TaxID=34254 RepID=A0AAV3RS80_LITER
MRTFSRCQIIGRRFPICHVHVDDTYVEVSYPFPDLCFNLFGFPLDQGSHANDVCTLSVIDQVSSFSTSAARSRGDLSLAFGDPGSCDDEDYKRWKNCLQRDFTINGLMFDPYAKLVYDYTGGVDDIKKAKVRTIAAASHSLMEDCARILRAIRIAARLGFRFERETALTIKRLSHTVRRLDRGRLLMEMNYMLAFGSAEASLRLLWRFGLLEVLLPIQAAYLVQIGFRRRDKSSNMLLSLFSNLDKLLGPDRPCHNSLWVAILALHKALSDEPRDPLVVAAFSLSVYNGGDLSEALDISRKIDETHDRSFHELLEHQNLKRSTLKDKVLHLASSVLDAVSSMTDVYCVSRAMAAYPQAPHSDLVIIPLPLFLSVCRIFECVKRGKEKGFAPKHCNKIDYELLASGSLSEVRHVFARVVFDTIYPITSS